MQCIWTQVCHCGCLAIGRLGLSYYVRKFPNMLSEIKICQTFYLLCSSCSHYTCVKLQQEHRCCRIYCLNVLLEYSGSKMTLETNFSSVFTHENLSNIPTMDLKDDTPHPDDVAISPSKVSTVIAKLKSDKSSGPNVGL